MPGVKITATADTAEAAQKIEQFFNGISKGLERLSGIGEFLGGLGATLASAFSVEKLVEFTAHAIEGEAAMSKLSKETDISVETLAALRQAYIAAGGNAEEFSGRINIFTQRVGLAYRQGGQLAQVFRDMGVPIASATGQLLPMEEILAAVAAKLASLHDAASKADFGRELFGRDSHEVVQTLSKIGANFDELRSKSPFSSQQAQSAEDFMIAVRQLHEQLNLMFVDLANNILPTLKQFVDWMHNTAQASSGVSAAAGFLTDIFRGLAVSVDLICTLFNALGTIIGQYLGFAWEQAVDGGRTFLSICKGFSDVIPALEDEVLSLAKALGAVAKAMVHAVNHDFASVIADLAPALADLNEKGLAVGAAISKGLDHASFSVKQFALRSGADMASFLHDGIGAAKKDLEDFGQRAMKLFTPPVKPSGPATAETSAKGRSAGPSYPVPPPESDEAKRVMAEIDKQYAASTQGRIALLNLEEAKLKKECDDEIHDVTLREAEKTKIAQIYSRQRAEIEAKEAQEKANIHLAALKAQEEAVNKNPDLMTDQKQSALLSIYQRQLSILQQQATAQKQIASSKDSTPEQQVGALKEVQSLTSQILATTRQISEIGAQNNIFEQMRQSLVKLVNDWGTAAQQMGKVLSGTVSTAVNSLSDNITKGIMGTERWSQVWKSIGVSIETEIIQAIIKMFAQLVIGMIMQATIGKMISAASTAALAPIAAAQSAIWAAPATLATIASYGVAADDAPMELAGALAAGQAVAAIGGMAGGGLVDGPGTGTSDSILRRLSKGEYVIPAHIVQSIGPEFFENLRSGAIGAQNLYGNVMSGLSRPVTSDSDVAGKLPGLGGGGGNSSVNVEGHKVAIIQVKDKNEMREALYEHADHIVHIVTSNKKKIGIPT